MIEIPWILIGLLGLASTTLAQTQIAFVDVDRVLSESAQGKSEEARLNSLIEQRTREIDVERDALNNLQMQLSQLSFNQAQNEIAKLQSDIQSSNTKIQRLREDAQSELDLEQDVILKRLSENVRGLLTKLGKERGYGAVFLKSPDRQIFVKDALDITDEVIRLYNARFPAN